MVLGSSPDSAQIFRNLDVDGDGTVTMVEIERGFAEMAASNSTFGFPFTEAIKRTLMLALDRDGSGEIELSEFETSVSDVRMQLAEAEAERSQASVQLNSLGADMGSLNVELEAKIEAEKLAREQAAADKEAAQREEEAGVARQVSYRY
jgi:hypothetical protein